MKILITGTEGMIGSRLVKWVEDKHENAVTGDRLGLNSVLISHDHNKDSYFERYDNWKELYEEIK